MQINESIRSGAAYISGTCCVSNSPIAPTLLPLIPPTLSLIWGEQVDHGSKRRVNWISSLINKVFYQRQISERANARHREPERQRQAVVPCAGKLL